MIVLFEPDKQGPKLNSIIAVSDVFSKDMFAIFLENILNL